MCSLVQSVANPNCPEPNGPDYDFANAPILSRLTNGRDVIVIGQKSGVGFALDPEKHGEVLWQYRKRPEQAVLTSVWITSSRNSTLRGNRVPFGTCCDVPGQ